MNRHISFLLIMSGVIGASVQLQSQWTYVNAVDLVAPDAATNSLTLQERAEAGEIESQAKLAEGYLGKRLTERGIKKDPIQAFKWAYIASSNGSSEATNLLGECRLFMSAEDQAEGKALAEAYLAGQNKPRGAKSESDNAQGAAPELPPAAADRDSSKDINPKTESEAPADNGGR